MYKTRIMKKNADLSMILDGITSSIGFTTVIRVLQEH